MNVIFPTAYFPNIQYFTLLLKTDNPKIEACESYRKQTCRNRCVVSTANGLQVLTVPVVKTNGNHTLTKDVTISYKEPWQQIHSRCIEAAYRKSPYFDYCYDILKPILTHRFDLLTELNENALKAVFHILKIEKKITYTEDFTPLIDENDLRTKLAKCNNFTTGYPVYYQVFSDRNGFTSNLSVLDLVFNEGPEGLEYLSEIHENVGDKRL